MELRSPARLALVVSGVILMPFIACTPQESKLDGLDKKKPTPKAGAFTPAPASQELKLPYDAAPSPDGSVIYYTSLGASGESHSLWSVPADGSAAATELATDLVAPLSVAVSADGQTLYIADAGHDTADPADLEDDGDAIGALLAVPATGGAAAEVEGTYGLRVRGVEPRSTSMILTGTDPADGQRGVFELDDSGALNVIAKGAPFTDPSGVACEDASDGVIYVVDTSCSDDGSGCVIKVEDGEATVLTQGLQVGYPAGTALSLDEKTLFVSGLQDGPGEKEAAVHVVDVATGEHTTVSQGLEGNDEAGGLHRGRDVNEFAWSGSTTVYRITFE